MIKEIREQEPFVHLGFNKQEGFYYVGETVTVWQDKIYINDYDVTIASTGSTLVTQDNNKIELTFDTAGEYTVKVNVSDRDKTFASESNVLKINIEPITFGSKRVLWGDEEITFNN